MRREVKTLTAKAVESLVLSIELFNRPYDSARIEGVLIHADRAFEILLKAAILHRGRLIREPGAAHTMGFKASVNKCLTDATVKCLSEEQAITLQVVNGWRDAAQHYWLDLSEQELYMASQASVTLFADLLMQVFGEALSTHMPERVLPVSTSPPHDLALLVEDELANISDMLRPGMRRHASARARLRPLALLEAATAGAEPPSDEQLDDQIRALMAGRGWQDVFPGVAALTLTTEGSGLTYSLRISKKEGLPIRLVGDTNDPASVVAVRRVSELDYYSLGFNDLAVKVGDLVSRNKLGAVIRHLGLRESLTYSKEIRVGGSKFIRYSEEALNKLRAELPHLDIERIWQAHRAQLAR